MSTVTKGEGERETCERCGWWKVLCKCEGGEKGFAVHVFKPMVYEDICEKPLLIESKKHLKRECDKHGVTACRLM